MDLVEIQVRWETQYVHRAQTKLGIRSPSSNVTKQKHITYMNDRNYMCECLRDSVY